jgi:hypothetical protein
MLPALYRQVEFSDMVLTSKSGNTAAWLILGGLAFWLPTILISAIYRWNLSILVLNSAAVAGLGFLGVATRIYTGSTPRWGSMLAGIYVLGPAAMLASSSFSRVPSTASATGDWLWRILFCLFPPMTLWMATLNGMIFSVLLVSIVLPLLVLFGRK